MADNVVLFFPVSTAASTTSAVGCRLWTGGRRFLAWMCDGRLRLVFHRHCYWANNDGL